MGKHAYSGDQRGGLVDEALGLSAGRSGVRIPDRGKCWLGTTAVDARVNYPLYLYSDSNVPQIL